MAFSSSFFTSRGLESQSEKTFVRPSLKTTHLLTYNLIPVICFELICKVNIYSIIIIMKPIGGTS